MSKHVYTGIAIVVASAVGLYFYQQQLNQTLQKLPTRIIQKESARRSQHFNRALLERIANAAKGRKCNSEKCPGCEYCQSELHDDSGKSFIRTESRSNKQNQQCCLDGKCSKCANVVVDHRPTTPGSDESIHSRLEE